MPQSTAQKSFIGPQEALLINCDYRGNGCEGILHHGPISMDEATDLMANQEGNYQAMKVYMKGTSIDATELMEDVTEILAERWIEKNEDEVACYLNETYYNSPPKWVLDSDAWGDFVPDGGDDPGQDSIGPFETGVSTGRQVQ